MSNSEVLLQATLTGVLARSDLDGRFPQPDGMAGRIAFRHGFFTRRDPAASHSDDQLTCLAVGSPRFIDQRLDGLARSAGAASGWLAAFREHGDRAPDRVRGRFAVVVLNPAEESVWMAVDRFGTYPLCYAQSGDAFSFADRADAVPAGSRDVDPQALFDYLYFHMIPSPRTIFRGVSRLDAGHMLRWDADGVRVARYWEPRFAPRRGLGLERAKAEFLEIVAKSVRESADGARTGTFLSGGTDSSTVAGMLCRTLGAPAPTYSIGFDAKGYDEMAYARIAARHFGTDHHEYYVTPDDLVDGIPRVATHFDQPFGNSSAVPAWLCVRMARVDGVTRMLAGDGGDELFGGNSRYAKQRVFGAYQAVPGLLRKALLEPVLAVPGMDRVPIARKAVSYVGQAKVPLPDRFALYNLLTRLGPRQVLAADFLAEVDPDAPLAAQRTVWAASDGADAINRMLAFDWKYTLADNDLPKVLGATSLAGVDVAFPLLSDELLDFSLGLPAEWKLRGLTLRWFFKEALRGFLPDEIIAKKKHGFGLPFGVWTTGHAGLRALAHDTLASLKGRNVIRPAFIDSLLAELLPAHPGYYGEMVWILLTLELWLREHAPGYRL